MNIDPRHLLHLMAIADHGSFSHASTALGMSQPALSSSIATLEQRLGCTVLVRDRRGAVPNAVGEVLVRRARELNWLMQTTVDEARMKAKGNDGPLAVGATPSMTMRLLPDVLAGLGAAVVDAHVSVIEGLDDKLIPALEAGEIDLLLGPVGTRTLPAGLQEEVLFDDRVMLGVAPHHPLARRSRITVGELSGLAWVLPHRGSFYPRLVEAMFTTAGIVWPARCLYTNSFNLAEALVMQMDVVTLLSRVQIFERAGPCPVTIPIEGVGTRPIGYRRRKTPLSPLGEKFVGHLAVVSGRYAAASEGEASPENSPV